MHIYIYIIPIKGQIQTHILRIPVAPPIPPTRPGLTCCNNSQRHSKSKFTTTGNEHYSHGGGGNQTRVCNNHRPSSVFFYIRTPIDCLLPPPTTTTGSGNTNRFILRIVHIVERLFRTRVDRPRCRRHVLVFPRKTITAFYSFRSFSKRVLVPTTRRSNHGRR